MSGFDVGRIDSPEQAATLFSDYVRSQYNDTEQELISHSDGVPERNVLTDHEVEQVLQFASSLLAALPPTDRRDFIERAKTIIQNYHDQVAANATGYRKADRDLANFSEIQNRLEEAYQKSFGSST